MRFLLVCTVAVLLLFSCGPTKPNEPNMPPVNESEQSLLLGKGINISHWLSQSKRRGAERKAWFTEADMENIAKLGFEHVRLPVDEEQLWDTAQNKMPQAWKLLHNALAWANSNNLKVLVDLHIVRSHHFNKGNQNTLFSDTAAQKWFVEMWRQLSEELHTYPNSQVAYEILNEAVAPQDEQWNQLAHKAIAAIRQKEPHRKIVMGSNMWQSVKHYNTVRFPKGDTNIIAAFHFYEPMLLTHNQAKWVKEIKNFKHQGCYPGQAAPDSNYHLYPDSIIEGVKVMDGHKIFTKDTLDKLINLAYRVAQEQGIALYCGEFGCKHKGAPLPDRQRWYRDVITLFDQKNISWAAWDYKGGYGLFTPEGQPIDFMIKLVAPKPDGLKTAEN